MNRNEIYKVIYRELIAIVEGVEHKIANLANASALLFNSLKDINWVGFLSA